MKDAILTLVIYAAPVFVGFKYIAPKNPIRYGFIGGPIITALLAVLCIISGDSYSWAMSRVSYTFPIFFGLAWAGATVYLMTRPEGERGEEKLKVHLFESLVVVGVLVLLFINPLKDKFFFEGKFGHGNPEKVVPEDKLGTFKKKAQS